MKNCTVVILTVLLFSSAYSQQKGAVGFEAGTLINLPVNSSLNQQNGVIKYYCTVGYFFKADYSAQLISKNKLSFSIPFGISYLKQTGKYSGHPAVNIWPSAAALFTVSNNIINFSFGPVLQFENKNYLFSGSLAFNNCLLINSTELSADRNDFEIYLSSRLCALFKIGKNARFGPALEVFFDNIPYSIRRLTNRIKGNQYYYDFPSGNITGKNIWVNRGSGCRSI